MPFFSSNDVSLFNSEFVFDVIMDIESYPLFIPWCRGAKIISKSESTVLAKLEIRFGVINTHYLSEVTAIPPKENSYGMIKAIGKSGLFDYMTSCWKLTSLANSSGTLIEFESSFQFKSTVLNKLASTAHKKAHKEIISAFRKRLENINANFEQNRNR